VNPSTASRGPSGARPVPRHGVTLLELLVVLVLLGLLAALTAPALRRAREPDGESDRRVIALARSAAVRRGETLALDMSADGRWRLVVARGDSTAIEQGTLAATPMVARRLLLTPLGLCLPDDDERSAAPWDPAACRVAAAAGDRR